MEQEKLVLNKNENITPHLASIALSDDGENFLFTELALENKGVDALTKNVPEVAKEVFIVNLANNNIPDPTFLKDLNNLVHLDLAKNKVKTLNIFT